MCWQSISVCLFTKLVCYSSFQIAEVYLTKMQKLFLKHKYFHTVNSISIQTIIHTHLLYADRQYGMLRYLRCQTLICFFLMATSPTQPISIWALLIIYHDTQNTIQKPLKIDGAFYTSFTTHKTGTRYRRQMPTMCLLRRLLQGHQLHCIHRLHTCRYMFGTPACLQAAGRSYSNFPGRERNNISLCLYLLKYKNVKCQYCS